MQFGVKENMAISVSNNINATTATPVANKKHNPELKEECTVKPNNLKNNLMSAYQKTTSAFTEYPAKGLKGSKKSNFYEFLAMGTVPYLVGSAMFMAVFNGVSHLFSNDTAKVAKSMGRKMALGVAFYGIAKSLSKKLISTPVKMATGIDTEMGYERHVYSKEDNSINEYEQHKVMESHDFPRYDMLYGENLSKLPKYAKKGEVLPHNYLYDKIAKKNGLGENLPSSDTDVKPIIKDVISRSNTAKSISSYLWAAVGVILAVQQPWNNFFRATEKVNWTKYKPSREGLSIVERTAGKAVNTAKNLGRITKSFGRSFVNASKELVKGPEGAKGWTKHAGTAIVGLAALSSIVGAWNTIHGAKTAVGQDKNVFKKQGKITVQ